jgi:hypothetical protein
VVDGDAVRGLRLAGRRYAAAIRMITLPVAAAVAVAAVRTPSMRMIVIAAWCIVTLWSVAYVGLVMRTHARWPTAVDALILSGLALSTPWTVPELWLSTGKSWVVPFCSFACVAYQYYERWLFGGAVALVLVVAMVLGTAVGRPAGSVADGLVTAVWTLVITALARLMWTLVHRGGRQADAMVADAAQVARKREVATRIRADELFTNRKLHDTAATTLLLVGLGQQRSLAALLSARAERDLAFLQALRSNAVPAQSDLIDLLQDAIEVSALEVRWATCERVQLDPAVAHALADAAAEALRNAERHAAVTTVTLSVVQQPSGVQVEVRDTGLGFDPECIPDTRRGLRQSIIARMVDVGGAAHIDSAAGKGTIVRLEWRRA